MTLDVRPQSPCFDGASYRLEHVRRVSECVVVPEPDHSITVRGEDIAAHCVVQLTDGRVVLPTIQFDDEADFQAGKIRKVGADRMLAAEAQAQEAPAAQVVPETSFRIGLGTSQMASEVALVRGDAHAGSMRGEELRKKTGKLARLR